MDKLKILIEENIGYLVIPIFMIAAMGVKKFLGDTFAQWLKKKWDKINFNRESFRRHFNFETFDDNLKITKILEDLKNMFRADRCEIFQFHNGSYYANGTSCQKMSRSHMVGLDNFNKDLESIIKKDESIGEIMIDYLELLKFPRKDLENLPKGIYFYNKCLLDECQFLQSPNNKPTPYNEHILIFFANEMRPSQIKNKLKQQGIDVRLLIPMVNLTDSDRLEGILTIDWYTGSLNEHNNLDKKLDNFVNFGIGNVLLHTFCTICQAKSNILKIWANSPENEHKPLN